MGELRASSLRREQIERIWEVAEGVAFEAVEGCVGESVCRFER